MWSTYGKFFRDTSFIHSSCQSKILMYKMNKNNMKFINAAKTTRLVTTGITALYPSKLCWGRRQGEWQIYQLCNLLLWTKYLARKKTSKIEQDQKTLTSAFPYCLTAIAKVLFFKERLGIRKLIR